MKTIYLGAGEFWLLEAIFGRLQGVIEVIPGYMGGTVPEPSHEAVSTGTTGHAEVIKVTYDDTIISTDDLLSIFFASHDPAIPNRIGPGIGSQYRSVIFYTDTVEAEAPTEGNGDGVGVMQHAIDRVQVTLPEGIPVATQIISATTFYPANESHYNYYSEHPEDMFSTDIIKPKLIEVQQQFPDKFQ